MEAMEQMDNRVTQMAAAVRVVAVVAVEAFSEATLVEMAVMAAQEEVAIAYARAMLQTDQTGKLELDLEEGQMDLVEMAIARLFAFLLVVMQGLQTQDLMEEMV